jgi:aryl-alcohol dehydrogenase-like predicted oxidoreductase
VSQAPLTPEQCYRFVLSNPHVHLALTGPANRDQLRQNFAALEQGPLTDVEMEQVREYGRQIKAKKRLDYLR